MPLEAKADTLLYEIPLKKSKSNRRKAEKRRILKLD